MLFRSLYDAGVLTSHKFGIPVICVGNITVGGTGKTPHTEYLAGVLKTKYQVAVLSRGYKRKSSGFSIAGTSSIVNDIGDEPLQISRKYPDMLVAVDRNRVNGVNSILRTKPDIEVIILDDGFQHRKIKPGLSIILCDYNRPFINDHLMPYGNLRESRSNVSRADIIIVTKSPADISPISRRIITEDIGKAPFQKIFFTSIIYKDPLPVFAPVDEPVPRLKDIKPEENGVVLVTGIAAPDPFKEYISRFYGEIIHLRFPDHHSFDENDLKRISMTREGLKSDRRHIITTEKDAVKLREFTNIEVPLKREFYYIGVEIMFLNNEKPKFDNLIFDYVRKNKRDNRIS